MRLGHRLFVADRLNVGGHVLLDVGNALGHGALGLRLTGGILGETAAVVQRACQRRGPEILEISERIPRANLARRCKPCG
jgi:hypothetical protein